MKKIELAKLGYQYHTSYLAAPFYEKVEVSYKYRGQLRTRTEYQMTEEGLRVRSLLASERVFRCPCCGRLCALIEMELWLGSARELAADKVPCSACYEDGMGEDL